MTRSQAVAIHVSNLLVGATGLVYGWMLYFVESEDPFAIANHPWQADFQHFHVLSAPLLVFSVALIWAAHVWPRVVGRFRRQRVSGLSLTLSFFPMVFSGYLLQVSVEEAWKQAWTWIHIVTSIIWLLFGIVHPCLGYLNAIRTNPKSERV